MCNTSAGAGSLGEFPASTSAPVPRSRPRWCRSPRPRSASSVQVEAELARRIPRATSRFHARASIHSSSWPSVWSDRHLAQALLERNAYRSCKRVPTVCRRRDGGRWVTRPAFQRPNRQMIGHPLADRIGVVTQLFFGAPSISCPHMSCTCLTARWSCGNLTRGCGASCVRNAALLHEEKKEEET